MQCILLLSLFQIPEGCSELHHEVELGVVISERCSGISESSAMQHVAGYALALDMTARDFQVGWRVRLCCALRLVDH